MVQVDEVDLMDAVDLQWIRTSRGNLNGRRSFSTVKLHHYGPSLRFGFF